MNKSNLTRYGLAILLGMVMMFFFKQCKTEIVEVPITIEAEVPVIEVQHDTIYTPEPVPYVVKEIDTSLVEEYKKANDSLKQELFESAVTVNTYKEVFEDSIQTITVDAEVTGKLNSLSVGYKTKPRTIEIDTVIPIRVPSQKWSISPYAEVGIPTTIVNPEIVFKAGLDYTSKSNIIYGASYDTQGRVWGKIGLRF